MKRNTLLKYAVFALMLSASSAAFSQVKIGNNPTTINGSAVLELESTNKGFLPTRIPLTGSTDIVTIPAPVDGMIVFNTATVADITPGMYYFYNGAWKRVEVASGGSGANASSQTVAFVGSYTDQVANGVKIGNYSFRIKRRTGYVDYTYSSEYCDAQIKYSGPNANEQITGYANTLYSSGQYDYSGTVLAAPIANPDGSTARNNSVLTKDVWFGIGEEGFVTAPAAIEKRQYVITPAAATEKNFYRVEWALIDPTNYCGTCNFANPSENDAKVIIFIEYLKAN